MKVRTDLKHEGPSGDLGFGRARGTVSSGTTFVLPGRWWAVGLSSPEETARSARAMASQLYRGDELATLRKDVRNHVFEAAEAARKTGAFEFRFALEAVPGIPIPLTLARYLPHLPVQHSAEVAPELGAGALRVSLEGVTPGASCADWPHDGGAVVRVLQLDPPREGLDRMTLRAEYWLLAPGAGRPEVFAFAAPVLVEEMLVPLLELLDAVVDTVRWA